MRKFIITIIGAICIYSCNQAPSYTINGKVAQPELGGTEVFLNKVVDDRLVPFDTTVVSNGAYRFKGMVAQPDLFVISIGKEKPLNIEFVIENADIHISSDSLESKISGTPLNERFQVFKDAMTVFENELNPIGAEFRSLVKDGKITPELQDSLMKAGGSIDNKMQQLRTVFVKENINNPAGQSQLSLLMWKPAKELQEIIAGADSSALQTAALQKVTSYIQATERTAIGKPFIDFRMSTPNDEEAALSNYAGKGKFVLVDFWASWCGPCREEMPNVIKAYNKYKNKGFEIVGISLDTKRDAWIKGIESFKMPWPQLSDLKGFQSEATTLYAVKGIPYTLLLDKDGIIIDKNLRGEKLGDRLEEIFGK